MLSNPGKLELARLERVARRGLGLNSLRAVRDLEESGEPGIEPLIRLLEVKDIEVAAAAAAALGRIGDHRTTEALLQALRRSFLGGTARRNRWVVPSLTAAIPLIWVSFLAGAWLLKIGFIALCAAHVLNVIWGVFVGGRQKRSPLAKALTGALAEIAERHPTAQLTSVVEDLRAVAADRLQQTEETRQASMRTAERIEALLGDLRNLPVAADAPAVPTGSLPVPARQPEPDAQALPRVHGQAVASPAYGRQVPSSRGDNGHPAVEAPRDPP